MRGCFRKTENLHNGLISDFCVLHSAVRWAELRLSPLRVSQPAVLAPTNRVLPAVLQ